MLKGDENCCVCQTLQKGRGLNLESYGANGVLVDKGVELKKGFTKNRETAASELSEMMR